MPAVVCSPVIAKERERLRQSIAFNSDCAIVQENDYICLSKMVYKNNKLKNSNSVIRLVFILVCLATILNGSVFWLKRVGILGTETHQYLQDKRDYFNKLQLQFESYSTEEKIRMARSIPTDSPYHYQNFKRKLTDHVFSVSGWEIATKIFKYLLTVIVILVIFSNQNAWNLRSGNSKLLSGLLFLVVISTGYSVFKFGTVALFAGFAAYFFVLIAWLHNRPFDSDQLGVFSNYLMLSLVLLLLMAPMEIIYGLKLFTADTLINKRMSGFMIQPTTFGVYIVCCTAFYFTFHFSRITGLQRIALILLSTILIALSGSNTAAIVYFVYLIFLFTKNLNTKFNKAYAGLAGLILCIFLLLIFDGRFAFTSLTGRIDKYIYYFDQDISILNLIFGHGIGIGSNTIKQIQQYFPSEVLNTLPFMLNTDSTPLMLMIQIGILGCVLFYAIVIKTMLMDAQLRPVYLVFILSSLTINIIEVFPLNLLLGLMLAKSFGVGRPNSSKPVSLASS